jgi:hypothetical protein
MGWAKFSRCAAGTSLKMARHPSLRSRGPRSSPANTVTRAIFGTIQEKGCRPSAD